MKKGLFLIVLVVKMAFCYSQRENNVWYFGVKAGLDFNNGNPVNLNNSQAAALTACSSICNSSGQLLFYSNGKKVWNRNHQVMPNGTDLMGSDASTQSSIIIPKPNSNTIYYLFTNVNNALPIGIRFSEIDMTLNGGLGDVTLTKNIPLYSPACEKLCAVKNYADNTYWLLSHGFGNNEFAAFKIDASGVNTTPILSNVGSIVGAVNPYNTYNAQGYLKLSPDGSKIVCVNSYINVELFDFDVITGQVSNPILVNSFSGNRFCYSAEFSPSGNFLYVVARSGPAGLCKKIYQYDVQAQNIQSSEVIIINGNYDFGGIQLAPNCKIYIGNNALTVTSQPLYVINNPDVAGTMCDFQPTNMNLTGICLIGLPQFIQNTNCKSRVILNDDLCIGDASSFYLAGDDQILQASWQFGDGNTSNLVSPTHTYNAPGNYIVTGDFATQTGNFTISKQITVAQNPVAYTVPDVVFCGQTSATYNLTNLNTSILGNQSNQIYGISYFASASDAASHNNLLSPIQTFSSNATTIYAKVYRLSNFDCYSLISFKILLTDYPTLNPITDFKICDDGSSNDGIATFDLNTKTLEILNGQSPNDFSVKYFENLNDAQGNIHPILNPVNNTINPQKIYARIAALPSEECSLIGSFDLVVSPSPEVNLNAKYVLCRGNQNSVYINLPNHFQSYLWSTGNQTNTVNINTPGNYWVTVTQNLNQMICSRTFYFEVILSDKAIIQKIQTQDWTDHQNIIQIIVDPQSLGDYEYSIDGIHYQDSNEFQNLSAQEYDVYVRDKNGCGITTDQVFLLMYPKFFTPNEDGYNDTWEIKFSQTEPNISIQIFDRYGKLLAENVKQWDGKFQGKQLPADDYWFVVKRENKREYKGHFSIKR